MRAMITTLSIMQLGALLISADALAATTPAYTTDQMPVARAMPSGAPCSWLVGSSRGPVAVTSSTTRPWLAKPVGAPESVALKVSYFGKKRS